MVSSVERRGKEDGGNYDRDQHIVRDTAGTLVRKVCFSDRAVFVSDARRSIIFSGLEVLDVAFEDSAKGEVDVFSAILVWKWVICLIWLPSFELYAIFVEGIRRFGSGGDSLRIGMS
ncbi:MAG: hypothetical protein Q9222_001841 [Ikaeria aurantiellina]